MLRYGKGQVTILDQVYYTAIVTEIPGRKNSITYHLVLQVYKLGLKMASAIRVT